MMTSLADQAALSRRELATRKRGWARAIARALAMAGFTPNTVSLAGVGFALASGAAFYVSAGYSGNGRAVLLLAAAASIQLRLLCNLLDGMLAVEEHLKSATGEIFNDLPDRISDVVILVGAGYATRDVISAVTLGWVAATGAVLTAYVRLLGGAMGVTQHFIGPMAKQHRMFALTVGTLAGAVEASMGWPSRAIPTALAIVAIGSVVTATRRVTLIAREVQAR